MLVNWCRASRVIHIVLGLTADYALSPNRPLKERLSQLEHQFTRNIWHKDITFELLQSLMSTRPDPSGHMVPTDWVKDLFLRRGEAAPEAMSGALHPGVGGRPQGQSPSGVRAPQECRRINARLWQ